MKNMFEIWKAACSVAIAIMAISTVARGQVPGVYNFNADWRLNVGQVAGGEATTFDDGSWKAVTLPHAFNEDEAFRKDIRELSTGIAWYRKTFSLTRDAVEGKVFLEFEGVRHAGRVWVNGKEAALSENGVMAFGADVTDLVVAGQNVVAVRCDNAWDYREQKTNTPFQWNDRNFNANYGGINKNVKLHVKDRLYQTLPLYSNLGTTGIYIYAKDFDLDVHAATIVAESQVRNEYAEPKRVEYAVAIVDVDDKLIASFATPAIEVKPGETTMVAASAAVKGLNFWSWGYGYLYTVTTTLKVDGQPIDVVATRTGFRKTEFTGGTLKLNGRTIHLKGYAQRTTNEWPALGINVPAWLSDFSNGLMVESNANLVRWMHITPSKQDVESCDRVGLMQAMPAGDSEKDVTGRRWEARVELMRDAILYNRNNPSVIFYEAGNAQISDEHMAEMLALKQQYDPHGGRAMGSRDMLGSKAAEWGGEMLYINKSADKPMWATEYMRDESLRKYMDEHTPPFHRDGNGPMHQGKPATSYNRNQDSMVVETVKRWYDYWRERPGTGLRVNGGGVNIIFSDSNTHHRGAENYRRSGEVDAMRLLKEGFYAHQVMWGGWVDVDGPTAHIVGHWNYAPGTVKDTYVVSSADKVELLVNGKSFGYGEPSSRFLFTFPNVTFEAGVIIAVGYDTGGTKVCTTEIRTAGEPVAIKLTPITNPAGFRADGSDVALVDVEAVDANGQRCPTAFNEVTFALDGPAEWRGGIAQGPENYILARTLPVELGVNRVIVRSTTTPGTITLKATSTGLTDATLKLKTQSVPVIDGRSTDLPSIDLRPRLSRGPTPAGESVHPTRTPLMVSSVTAGSAQEAAQSSMDDNEDTTWTSTGSLGDAWIKYQLSSPATVSEMTMRLSSWRSRSYPIRVLVDDQEVYLGATPRSLGYVTVPLTPTRGSTVTVQLIGAPSDKDQFDMTEVTGMKLKAGTADGAAAKGVLQIGELELYGPVN